MFSPGDTFSLGAEHQNTLLWTCRAKTEGVRGGEEEAHNFLLHYTLGTLLLLHILSYLTPDVVTQQVIGRGGRYRSL